MRTISWIKHPVVFLFGAAIAAGCGSDSKPAAPPASADAGPSCNGASNNKKETGEDCDGTDLGGATCQSVNMGMYKGGKLTCNANCSFNTKACTTSAGGAGGGGGKGGQGGSGNVGNGGSPQMTGGAPNDGGGLDGSMDGSMDGSIDGSSKMDSSTPPVDSGKG